jgi:hypothetical protein
LSLSSLSYINQVVIDAMRRHNFTRTETYVYLPPATLDAKCPVECPNSETMWDCAMSNCGQSQSADSSTEELELANRVISL